MVQNLLQQRRFSFLRTAGFLLMPLGFFFLIETLFHSRWAALFGAVLGVLVIDWVLGQHIVFPQIAALFRVAESLAAGHPRRVVQKFYLGELAELARLLDEIAERMERQINTEATLRFLMETPPDGQDLKIPTRNIVTRRQAEEEVKRLTAELEALITERTTQLAFANAALQNKLAEVENTQRQLRESENRYRILMEQASDGILIFDASGFILEANQRAGLMFGYQVEELIGRPLKNLTAPDSADTSPLHYNHLADLTLVLMEQVMVHRDGHRFAVEASAAYLSDGRMQAILRDITERKQAEAALHESEERHRQLVNFAPEAILVVSNNQIVFVNQAALRLLGATTSAQLVGKTPNDLVPPFGRTQLDEIAANFETNPSSMTYEVTLQRLDGTYRSVEVTAIPYRHNGQSAALGIARDITERKHMEIALRESEQRHRDLIESAPEPIIVSANDKLVYVNGATLRLLGASDPEQVRHRSLFSFLPAPVQVQFQQKIQYLLENKRQKHEVVIFDVTLECLDGRVVRARIMAMPFLQEGRSAFLALAHDITEHRAIEADLRKDRELLHLQLEERNAELVQINERLRRAAIQVVTAQEVERQRLSGILHDETGQALLTLKADVEHLEQEVAGGLLTPLELAARFTDIVLAIATLGDRMREMAHELRPNLLKQWGLSVALRSLSENFKRRTHLAVTYINLIDQRFEDVIEVTLYRFLQEALNNILKHSHAREVRVTCAALEGVLQIEVQDDGVGFSPKNPAEATGMGLMDMQERFNLLGGQVSITSQPGTGTRLVARLPLTPEVRL